ncbi:MAG: hypothetical protein HW392_934 [Steroidobacteraceae bacterium]|nr:hypothetical protein [Steroidobacteraceae bacterium]
MNIRISMAIAAVLVAAATQADAAQNLSKRAAVAADATIDVSNVEGRVDVTAWDRNEVELTAVLEDDKDRLEFEATDRQVRIKVVRPNDRYGNRKDAILTLKIPKDARISAETVSADITVAGVLGEQRLESVSGEVRTQAYDAPVKLSTVSGDGTISGTGGNAALTVESVSGLITASGIRGSYDGEVVSGSLTINLAAAERLNARSISGDIDAHVELMPTARVEMETVSGEIKFTMNPPVNAEFDMESFSGDIESCFGKKARDKNRYGPGSELSFTEGSGGARVSINSLSGDITICDR